MDHETQVELIERVLKLLEAGTTDMADRQFRSPVDRYISEGRLESEQDVIFGSYPLVVGRSDAVPDTGDFLTHDAAGTPLLVVRQRSGQVSAFLNVCRHRGTRLVTDRSGRGQKRFVCPYHAWTYDLDGGLVAIPHREGFPDTDERTCGLVKVPVAERHGFVFVTPRAAVPESVDASTYLGVLDRDFEELGVGHMVSYSPRVLRKRINWKLAFDIFLEGYHLKSTHTKTIWPMFLDNVGLYDRFSPHQRNLFAKRNIRGLAGSDPDTWDLRQVSNVLYVVFPNTLILVEPDHMGVFHVFPDGTDACEILSYTLLPEAPKSDAARRYWHRNIDILYTAIEEDFEMGESIQAGLRSGANTYLNFGLFEQALGWFHEHVEDALAIAVPKRAAE